MAGEAPMRFFVEESSFRLPAGFDLATLEDRLDRLVSFIDKCRQSGEGIFRWSELLTDTEIQPGVRLFELLYGKTSSIPIDHDTRIGLMTALERCVNWDERIDFVLESDVAIDGVRCWAPTAAVVRSRHEAGFGAACVCLDARADRTGILAVGTASAARPIHFVTEQRQLPEFFRSLIELEELEPDAYMNNALYAFPEVAFVPGLASQFAKFETRYREVRGDVTKHLAGLNDHFQRLFKENKGAPDPTMRQLSALCGVDASPESPNTRANKSAMKERDVGVDYVSVGGRTIRVGQTVRCEWHTKIKPTTDRIHFHPGADGVAEGRLIVGIFAGHLTV